jgi:hypothetical protein
MVFVSWITGVEPVQNRSLVLDDEFPAASLQGVFWYFSSSLI